jgi:hypothetical protein
MCPIPTITNPAIAAKTNGTNLTAKIIQFCTLAILEDKPEAKTNQLEIANEPKTIQYH